MSQPGDGRISKHLLKDWLRGELALAELARGEGPEAVLEALERPLERLTRRGAVVGLDVLGRELILAARAADATELEEAVRELLVASGEPHVVDGALRGLLEAAAEAALAGADEAVGVSWAALGLAVAAGDYRRGADALEVLAGVHVARAEPARAVRCLDQSATYRRRSGAPLAAAEARLAALELLSGDLARRADLATSAADDLNAAGEPARAAAVLLDAARAALGARRPKRALKELRRALTWVRETGEFALEAALYRAMAEAFEGLGDGEMAASYATRAELMDDDDATGA